MSNETIDAELVDDEPLTLAAHSPALPPALAEPARRAAAAVTNHRAHHTRRTYAYAWEAWTAWCAEHDLCPCPAIPEAIITWLTVLDDEERKPSTIAFHLAAIRAGHIDRGFAAPQDPIIMKGLKGIRRRAAAEGRATPTLAAPNMTEDLHQLVEAIPSPAHDRDLRPLRDRVLITLMWAGALRVSDVVALQLEDLAWRPHRGVVARIRLSKGDQAGEGQEVPLPYAQTPAICAVRALEEWVRALAELQPAITSGPVIRATTRHGTLRRPRVDKRGLPVGMSTRAVEYLLKRYYDEAGLPEGYGPRTTHSMRAGRITTALVDDGASVEEVRRISRHKKIETLLLYERRGDPFDGVPGIK